MDLPIITRDSSRRALRAALSLPVISGMEISCKSGPEAKGAGSTVSSMVRAETPAFSISSTVRMTLRALP